MNIFDNYFLNVNSNEISGLTDELKAIFINEKFNSENKNILVVVNTLFEASKLYQMLSNLNPNVLFFPMDDFITSEVLAVSPEFKISRLNTLNYLKNKKNYIVVTNLMGYLRYLPTKKVFEDKFINLKIGEEYEIKKLISNLYDLGYEKETTVNKSGQIAVRGYVIDLFQVNEENPIRIEFWGDQIETIKYFDVNTQLTVKKIDEIMIMPNTEFLNEKNIILSSHKELCNYTEVVNINHYTDGLVIYNDYNELKIANENLQNEIIDYLETNEIDLNTKFMNEFEKYEYDINLSNFDNKNSQNTIHFNSFNIDIKDNSIDSLNKLFEQYIKQNKTIILCVTSRYQVNNLLENINVNKKIFTNEKQIFPNYINIIIKKVDEGFTIDDLVVITANEIFGKNTKNSNYKNNLKIGTKIKDINKINIGDYIVHSMYGIGRYLGIKTIKKNNLQKDYIQLEYKDGDKLYIPVEKIELISKFSSKEGYTPKVNKLGTKDWEKTKSRARKRANEMAFELLKLYAARETVEGFSYLKDDENQINFENEFIYEETSDQIRVTEEIKRDMESNHPMDRLLCGDVGYGKTEIAFRAAFKAILSGKQVAMLCPTTILSNQHFQNAVERFKSFPVNIRLLNRFVSTKKVNETIKEINEGKVDFVIGTHKILNDKIIYKDLGLLIVDEEQRFGVTHKEKIKNYRNNIDVLTLSATPIPRTLQLSLANVRSLSLLETPPNNRFPVQTYVVAKNKNLIKEAIYKELTRNGQVFILYNRIDGIESEVREIQNLVKEARISYAHGRMDKDKLENIMIDFIEHKYDVLVCTTIIESGIDIPNVNTLIVMEADKFGLSQLYQLRGRVGRTNKIAYCYLMYNQDKILTEIASKRLKAIKEFTELGSGFSIAMRDLSLRGAGDLLGSEQAGFIDSVGVELFIQMLNEEVAKINGTYTEKEETSQPLLDVSTYISDDYVEDEELKILIHKKISEIDSKDKLEKVKFELEDRFGKLNEEIIIYMYEQLFEYLANTLNIKKTLQTDRKIEIILEKEITEKIDGEKLFMSVLDITHNIRFSMKNQNLILTLDLLNLEKHFVYILVEILEIIKKAI